MMTTSHGRETSTPERTERAMQERRKGIRGLIISAVVLAALLAFWWLVATTNSEGHHDASSCRYSR
jgi:multidrug resistance efflux pump